MLAQEGTTQVFDERMDLDELLTLTVSRPLPNSVVTARGPHGLYPQTLPEVKTKAGTGPGILGSVLDSRSWLSSIPVILDHSYAISIGSYQTRRGREALRRRRGLRNGGWARSDLSDATFLLCFDF